VSPSVITFLSDYGLVDEFVGVCHGVIAGICPEAKVIDLSHGIDRHDVRLGAVILANAIPYMPVGVHLAIVDPSVGGNRRAVALGLADERILVGPDNGLLWPVAEVCGGVVEAYEISHSPLRLEPVSATFHGRDIFSPVAAHLAAGTPLAEAGPPLDPAELIQLQIPRATISDGRLLATVTNVDRFGNVQLGATHEDAEQLGLRLGHELDLQLATELRVARFVRTFAEAAPGDLIVYEDAARKLAIAFNTASAAGRLGLRIGDEVSVSPRPAG
jgi:S-adenosyl-L-methionine hydrolase (adenosine-forming)